MILYYPDGDIYTKKIRYRPKVCFLMTKIGKPVPRSVVNIRKTLKKYLNKSGINIIDADTHITGKDFLIKIWECIFSVPLGIAIITEDLSSDTIANIFYEVGVLQALGKETLIIKTRKSNVPSDFVRTEYIDYDRKFKAKINKFLKTFSEQADHYYTVSDSLAKDPLLAVDYLKRSYLMNKSRICKRNIKAIVQENRHLFGRQSTNSINGFFDGVIRQKGGQ